MLEYRVYQNKNKVTSTYGKFYARAAINQSVNIDGLAHHMSQHNTPFSKGVIKGMLTDMVACIHELVLNGTAVKIDDLAIFSVGIEAMPADTAEDWSIASHLRSYKLRARATGEFSRAELNAVATSKEAAHYEYNKKEAASKETEQP